MDAEPASHGRKSKRLRQFHSVTVSQQFMMYQDWLCFHVSAFPFRLYPCLRSPQTSACCQDADIMGSQRRKKLSFTAGWDSFACSCPGITSIQQSWITDLGINLGFTGHFLSPPTSCRRCFVQKVCQFSTGNMSHLSVKFGW